MCNLVDVTESDLSLWGKVFA